MAYLNYEGLKMKHFLSGKSLLEDWRLVVVEGVPDPQIDVDNVYRFS